MSIVGKERGPWGGAHGEGFKKGEGLSKNTKRLFP